MSTTAPSSDTVGHIETAGVEFIPEQDRDSRPWNIWATFIGGNFAWSVVIFGWLPVVLGLDFWGATTSTVLGTLAGAVLIAPLAFLGPRTGTNMTVSSSAFFGIRGRFIGSAIALTFAILFTALAVWTSGDGIVAAGHRLFGLPDNNWVRGAAYALISAGIVAAALYGHATVVALYKLIIPIVGLALIAGVFAFQGKFNPHTRIADYSLGGYWQTWALSFALAFAGVISYVPFIGDYTRRVSRVKYSDFQVAAAVSGGILVGCVLPALFGIFTAVTFVDASDSYVADLVNQGPAWYVLPILIVSLFGGLGQGVMNVYASGLDLEGLLPKLTRFQTTLITAAISVILLYVGVFIFNAVDTITAITLLINAFATPWTTIMIIGAIRTRKGVFIPEDLQAFAQGRHGGAYWYLGGWNLMTVCVWAAGSVFGVLTVNCDLYVGPLANLAGGIDISVAGTILVTAVAYLIVVRIRPQRSVLRGVNAVPADGPIATAQ